MVAYLRVVAGFFAAMFTWMTLDMLVAAKFSTAVVAAAFAGGLWYFAVVSPLRVRRAQITARHAALAARADAGHAAFLAGHPHPYPAPPAPEPFPRMRTGVKVAIALATGLFAITLLGALDPAGPEPTAGTPATVDTPAP
jgi:hypothetical protein